MNELRAENAAGSRSHSDVGRPSPSPPAYGTSGLIATTLFDGPITGARFRDYVEQTLVLALRPSDTVMLDNLPAHKVSGIRERIEAAGARLLYLPAYYPDFNPIELAFAKLKAILHAEAARPIGDL